MEILKFKFLKTLAVLTVVGIASSAIAGPSYRLSSKAPVVQPMPKRAYVFGYGGIDSGANYDTIGSYYDYYGNSYYNPGDLPIKFDLDNGWTAGGGAGVYSGLLGGSRFEVEGSYTANDVGYLNFSGFELPSDLDVNTTAVFFNMLKEIPFGGAIGYFGGGVGYGQTDISGDLDTIPYDDGGGGFAWQLIAGVDFPITDSLAFFTQYRYMVLSDFSFTTVPGDFTHVVLDNPSSHAVLFGARVSF